MEVIEPNFLLLRDTVQRFFITSLLLLLLLVVVVEELNK
jgi:hypothetical protein